MSKTITINPSAYKKLVEFAQKGGNVQNIGTIIGSLDEKVIAAHLALLKKDNATLWKKWGSKYRPEEEEDDPTAGLTDDGEEDPTAGLTDDEPAPPPVKPAARKKEATKGLDSLALDGDAPDGKQITINGKNYPEQFKLRKPNGETIELEVFSKSPSWGFMLRVPVPTDMRTLTLGGKPVQVDLLELRRDPDGLTEVGGKKYANSKLIAAAELED